MKRFIASNAAITSGLLLLFSVGCSSSNPGPYGDRSSAADRAPNSTLSAGDRDFAVKAAQGGMAEVEMGNLAQQRGSNDQIRDYGKKLVNDHTKANNDLKDIANTENITLPTDMGASHRKTLDRLGKLSGSEFDREFFKESVADHRKDIDEFQKEANDGSDPALKNFAARTLPTLQDHLQTAESNGMKK